MFLKHLEKSLSSASVSLCIRRPVALPRVSKSFASPYRSLALGRASFTTTTTTTNVSSGSPRSTDNPTKSGSGGGAPAKNVGAKEEEPELGAMSQRLQDLAEESDLLNPRATIRRMQEQQAKEAAQTQPEAPGDASGDAAGPSEALKNELLDRIKDADFAAENAAAISYSKLPAHASKHTRDLAMSQPWDGTESTFDASLRMLNDAHKPLRGKPEVQTSRSSMRRKPVGEPMVNNTLRARPKASTSQRIINARDAAGKYNLIKKPDDQMTPEERAEVRRMLKERFQPSARAVPATIEGLAALANEKIEDAFARGVFNNLSNAGKPMEQDHHANSPFIDTTTYLLNRAIQRQEITLPWIDRQKTLLREAAAFRSRLRATWRRHVMRTIASSGGGIEEWVRKAEEFAEAERIVNPDPALLLKEMEEEKEKKWQMDGRVTQIGERIPSSSSPPASPLRIPIIPSEAQQQPPATPTPPPSPSTLTTTTNADISISSHQGGFVPFRDPTWLATESGYHNLAIKTLNEMVVSYNLECPTIAQKGYYKLDFELKSCYRRVALEVLVEFKDRAANPDFGKYLASDDIDGSSGTKDGPGELMASITGGFGESTVIYEERKEKSYGFKQFWRDLFSKRDG